MLTCSSMCRETWRRSSRPRANKRAEITNLGVSTRMIEQLATDYRPPMADLFPLRVNDLKQFEYCPRIVFYNTVMPVERKSTIKMERGKEIELKLDALEARRTLRRYRLAEGERQYHVWLSSDRLGLSGKLDLLIVTPDACYPVDFKHTRDRPRRNHVLQLGGYAVLVEDVMQR